jgi:hypothetical protein
VLFFRADEEKKKMPYSVLAKPDKMTASKW